MDTVQKFTCILFTLPDGKVILQRRTNDAPYGAGLLGIFGGWVDEGENPDEGIVREIKEETSLDIGNLGIKFVADFVIPANEDFDKERHFYVYEGYVENENFKVYEGDGAEAYTLSEINERSDLIFSSKYIFDHIIKAD